MTYRIALTPMTFSDLHVLQVFKNVIFPTDVQQLTRF